MTIKIHTSGYCGRPVKIVKIGDLTIIGPGPTAGEKFLNSKQSDEALVRLRSGLTNPGATIPRKPGVPLYYANKDCPGTVIRETDGRKEVRFFVETGIWAAINKN